MQTVPADILTSRAEIRSRRRYLPGDREEGIISCGFLANKGYKPRDWTTFTYYGALLVLRGKGVYIDAEGKETPIGPGDFVQRMPGVPHQTPYRKRPGWLECYVIFGRNIFESLAAVGALDGNNPVLHVGIEETTVKRFADLIAWLDKALDDDLPLLLQETVSLAIDITSAARKRREPGSNEIIVQQARKMLGHNLDQRVNIPEIARTFHLSYERFRKIFREVAGQSPGNYRIGKRMEMAQTLLADRGYSIGEISARLGYTDTFTFSKQFRKFAGLSPSGFRRQL